MKETITSVNMLPLNLTLNAVFITPNGLKRKSILLAGMQTVLDDQTTQATVEAMVYRDSTKSWVRAKTLNGFLGVELAEFPNDWEAQVQQYNSQDRHMEQQAEEIVRAIERDRARTVPSVQQPQPVSPPQPQRDYSFPPDTLPNGLPWKKPMENLAPELQPATPQLTPKQRDQRFFKF